MTKTATPSDASQNRRRREFPAHVRRAVLERSRGLCECHLLICLPTYGAGCGSKLGWHDTFYEHIRCDALGGPPILGNAAVLCRACWRLKTFTHDLPAITKTARRRSTVAHKEEPPAVGPEEWRDVVNFSGRYQISSTGRVRSVDRLLTSRDGKQKRLRGKLLSCASGRPGYRCVQIAGRSRHVAHLVAEAFMGPRRHGSHVAHLNGNPSDDRAVNLAYASPKENNAHKIGHGTLVWGERLHLTKFSEATVTQVRREYASGRFTQRDLATKHGMSQGNVSALVLEKSWKHLRAEAISC